MKVLVAEDDLTSRMMLEGILGNWGYDVTSVEDGSRAWEILQKKDCPKVAILDWVMPGMDGLEVCKKVKAVESLTPVYIIILTGRDTKKDIVKGFDQGADDYLTKPFDENELQARLKVAFRMVDIQATLSAKLEELEDALEHVKVLQGVLPICMHCHNIRNDEQAWDKLEDYLRRHSNAEFSHSICPDCAKKYYSDYLDD